MNVQKLLYQNILWRGLFFGSGFLLNILIARHFDAAVTGWIYYLFTIFSFFTLIGSFSLEAGIVYFGSKKEIALSRLSGFSIAWTGVLAVLLVLGFFILQAVNYPVAQTKLFYALLFVCGNVLLTFFTGLFYSRQDYITSNIAGMGMNVLLGVLLFFSGPDGFLSDDQFIWIYFGSFLATGCLLTGLFFKKHTIPISLPQKKEWKSLFAYSSIVFFSNLVFFLLYKVDYWFVNRYCTADELGNYIQISKIAHMFLILPGMLAGSLFPLIAGNHIQKAEEMLKIISRTVFLVYSIVCVGLILTGNWLFPFVFGESFSGMYQPFLFLIPGILSLSMLSPIAAYFSGKNKVRINLTGSFLALCMIVAGDALFIPKYGLIAAASVSTAGYLAYHIFVLMAFKKMHHTAIKDFFIFQREDIFRIKQSMLKKNHHAATK